MKKNLFILICIFIYTTLFFPEVSNIKPEDLFEFSAGITCYAGYTRVETREYSSFFNQNFITIYDSLTLEFTIYNSFLFNIGKYFSLGFILQTGYNLSWQNIFGIMNHNIIMNLKLTGKIGYNKNFFAMETGLKINERFFYERKLYSYFFIGPSVLFGYEVKINKHLNFMVGAFTDFLFYQDKLTDNKNDYNKINKINLVIGLELRIGFYLYE